MGNKLLKIDNIMYKVSNLETAEKFYTDILGLKKCWVDEDRQMIGFKFENNDSEIVITSDLSQPIFDFSYLVESVKDFIKEFKKAGKKIEREPIDVRCGKYAIVLDDDGNKIPIIDLTRFNGKAKYN